jgi:cell wall-associated NlpC family hydrolase
MSTREQIVKLAESQLGVAYYDHAMLEGIGFDCAGLPMWAYKKVGLLPSDLTLPFYSPQQWLKRQEDRTYLDMVLTYFDEITQSEVQPGDLILYKLVMSWTHGALVCKWPDYVIHAVKDMGRVIGSHAYEGALKGNPIRFFRIRGIEQ